MRSVTWASEGNWFASQIEHYNRSIESWKNKITFGKIQGINEIAFQILTCTQRRRLVFDSKNKCNS